jgi:SET domain-containing protein
MSKKISKDALIKVKQSSVHGKGVFAVTDIAKNTQIIEYTGDRISWKQAVKRHPHDPAQPTHTFYFGLDDGSVIDALFGGNASMWINHSCKPNCKAIEEDVGKKSGVFLYAKKNIKAGEELFYDYGLSIEGKITKALKKDYQCHCGHKNCRGTMLSLK